MRSRSILLAAVAAVAGLAVFRTVAAQSPPGAVPPRGVPAGPTSSGVRPVGEWAPNTPPPGSTTTQPGAARPNTGRRLTSPVVAGADGVRPASAADIPPPSFELPAPPAAGGAVPPVVSREPGLSDPKPPPPLPALGPVEAPLVPPVAPPPPQGPPGVVAPPVLPPLPARNDAAVSPSLVRPSAVAGGPAKVAQSVVLEAVCPDAVPFGAEFRYELVVKNQGTAAVAGVRVEDAIPAGARFVGSDPPAEQSGDRLAWAVGTLEPGTEKRIAVRVKPADEGEVVSRAVVTYAATIEARTRVTRPRLAVAVTGPEVCKAGEQAAFKIKITNAGSGPAQKMLLQGFLSDGLIHPHGSKLEMQIDSLPAGETRTVDLPVAAGKAGPQACQVVVTAAGSADATARAAVNVVEPLLQVTQTGPAKCLVRAEPEYTITLSNPGTAATDPVTLYAVLPDGFEFVQAGDGGTYSAANRAVVWNLAGLAPNGSKAFTLKLRAATAGDGVLRTIAQSGREQPAQGVAGAGGVGRPAERVLKATAETPVKAEGVAAVRFEVIDLDDPVEVGKEAVYEVKVTNQGTGACTNVQLVAAMAEGAAYAGSSGPTQIKVQGQHLVFEPIANLAVKGEAVYRVKVRGSQAGDVRFRVQLTCDQVPNPVVKEESTRFVKD